MDPLAEVCVIGKVEPHPNADRLELATVKGWQVVVQKDQYKAGDVVAHVVPDTLVPETEANELGISTYLHFSNRYPEYGRVREARLRGQMSYGFLTNAAGHAIGTDIGDTLGLVKWEPPPPRCQDGDASSEHKYFHKYYKMFNLQARPELMEDVGDVTVMEKIHGMNCRIGAVRDSISSDWEFVIGSHNVQRKLGSGSIFETALNSNAQELLSSLINMPETLSVIIFGEIFGEGIQDLTYGTLNEFRMFDVSTISCLYGQRYVDWSSLLELSTQYSIPIPPILYCGPYDASKLKELSNQDTTFPIDHMSEGIVIRDTMECCPHPKWGRRIVKLKSDAYVLRKGGTENH